MTWQKNFRRHVQQTRETSWMGGLFRNWTSPDISTACIADLDGSKGGEMLTRQSWRIWVLVVPMCALFGSHFGLALAQSRSETLQAISKLKGNEREAKLREGARKEGNLIWYSSTTAEDSLALNRKFQELYPFVKVQHLRAPSEKMIERILLESRAGSFKADLVALPEIELTVMTQRKLL